MKTYQDTENKILGNLLRSPLESKSLHQIAVETGLSYVTVHKLAPVLLKRGLIGLEKKGKASLVSINFEQAESGRLSSAMLSEKNIFLKKNLKLTLLTKEIEDALSGKFYSLVLFGSYARGKAKEDSDIDLFFIVPDKTDFDEIKKKIEKSLGLFPLIKKDYKLVSGDDFIEMLNQKYTVGRAVFQQGIVLFGTEVYYSLVKKYVRTKGY